MPYTIMDDCLGKRFQKVISYKTSVSTVGGGFFEEERDAQRSAARRRWSLDTLGHTKDNLVLKLEMLFHEVRGQHITFIFKDRWDYNHWQISTDKSKIQIGTGTGAALVFQLVKLYGSGANQRSRNITNPIQGTLSIYLNNVLQTETTHYTVNYDTGVVTFVSAPGNGVAVQAEFEFRTRVRFDTDDLSLSAPVDGRRYLTSSVEIVEVKT